MDVPQTFLSPAIQIALEAEVNTLLAARSDNVDSTVPWTGYWRSWDSWILARAEDPTWQSVVVTILAAMLYVGL